MKKIILIAVALLVAAAPLGAQSKSDLRSAKSDAAAAAKSFRKDKFKMVELGDVQSRLEQYFIKVYSGCPQVVGLADNCVSANMAKMMAMNNAANEYAASAGSFIRGRITSDVSNITSEQADMIVAAYERLVEREIKGELACEITLLRRGRDGYDARAYCLVDVDAAHQARMKAMNRALEETNFAQQYGSMVSDWIDDGFRKLK